MNNPLEYEHEGVKYKVEITPKEKFPSNFFVDHPKYQNVPKTLCKYYSLDNFSLDAFKNSYLFSFHPDHSNDKYDSYRGLVNFDVKKELLIVKTVYQLGWYSLEEFEDIYRDHKRSIINKLEIGHQQMLFDSYGAISLTTNPDSILMWSHYARKNSGFLLEFDTEKLKKTKGFFGPFHINYTFNFRKVDADEKSSFLNLLYMTNIKHACWSYEEEWRFLAHCPNAQYHPRFNKIDENSRKFYYDKDAIVKVILATDFFDPYSPEVKFDDGHQEYCLLKLTGYKLNLIMHINQNKIPCYILIGEMYDFVLKPSPVYFEQLSSDTFKMKIPEYQTMIF